jgi:hypothetical protein
MRIFIGIGTVFAAIVLGIAAPAVGGASPGFCAPHYAGARYVTACAGR